MLKRTLYLKHSNEKENEIGNNKISNSLKNNIKRLKHILKEDATVVYKYFKKNNGLEPEYCIVFIEDISSDQIINDKIIRPIMEYLLDEDVHEKRSIDYIVNRVIQCRKVEKSNDLTSIVDALLHGDTILFVEKAEKALIIGTKSWDSRSISEPEAERVVRGPREGFTESLKTNVSLIRRKISSASLKFKVFELGTITKTKVYLCYLEGVASEKIIEELESRLNQIEIDGVLDSGYIQAQIEDSKISVFKTVGDTERPDIVAAKLLEGRVALISDGSPLALTVPYTFIEYFQINEDYYNNYFVSSVGRLLRIIAFFTATSLPAIYLAIVAFHQQMIPTALFLSFAAARADVPFPTIIETILLLLFFELMIEAGERLPLTVGQAVSIVGALILGEAAVTAKIVSAPMVIIMAVTGISSFLIPKMKGGIILIRILALMVASVFGLYGYMICFMVVVVYLMSLKSFGVPYMVGTNIFDKDNLKDTAIRLPWQFMQNRPKISSDIQARIDLKTPRRR